MTGAFWVDIKLKFMAKLLIQYLSTGLFLSLISLGIQNALATSQISKSKHEAGETKQNYFKL